MAGPIRSIDRTTFLNHLRQSGLVAEAELRARLGRMSGTAHSRALARTFVEQGLLTRFQAERLLMGRSAGFFLDQYRILEQVGRGGMGRVYRAEHRTLKRIVALKVLSADLLQTGRAVELFLHEVRAAAALVHPNIVTAFDANETAGRYYLVLEYVDGPNLDQLVRNHGPLSAGLACDYVRQVACGLQYAYRNDMVHRDVKPANILVQARGPDGAPSPGVVKISDFGLARIGPPRAGPHAGAPGGTILTRENTVMGTPDYLSPEQSRDLHKADIRSDLYSLGATFYFLLTGRVPFPGGTAMDKLIRHSAGQPAPIRASRDDVPPGVVAVVERLMAKHPADRFPTPADLAAALAPYAVGGPTPWAAPRAPAALPADEDAPPAAPDDSDGDLLALAVTVANDPSPTPGPSAPRHVHRPANHDPRPVGRALLLATCITVGALLAVALVTGALALFGNG